MINRIIQSDIVLKRGLWKAIITSQQRLGPYLI